MLHRLSRSFTTPLGRLAALLTCSGIGAIAAIVAHPVFASGPLFYCSDRNRKATIKPVDGEQDALLLCRFEALDRHKRQPERNETALEAGGREDAIADSQIKIKQALLQDSVIFDALHLGRNIKPQRATQVRQGSVDQSVISEDSDNLRILKERGRLLNDLPFSSHPAFLFHLFLLPKTLHV
jgi:hypothetical protein